MSAMGRTQTLGLHVQNGWKSRTGGGSSEMKRSVNGGQRPPEDDTEAYIRSCSEDWAALAVSPDPSVLQRILADDYVGVGLRGDLRDKTQQIKRATTGAESEFVASRVDYVNFRHFGDVVVAQGAEALMWRDAKPDLRLIWTDVWVFRKGKWQVVASQDSVRPSDTS